MDEHDALARALDSFNKLRDECASRFYDNEDDKDAVEIWKLACITVREHVDDLQWITLQSEFATILNHRGLDKAASTVRGHLYGNCPKDLGTNTKPASTSRAPGVGSQTRNGVTPGSPPQHYAEEFTLLNKSSRAETFGHHGHSPSTPPRLSSERVSNDRTVSAPTIPQTALPNEDRDAPHDRRPTAHIQRAKTVPPTKEAHQAPPEHSGLSGLHNPISNFGKKFFNTLLSKLEEHRE
ncbi:hypothetical protein B0T25DRAFT_135420 [Lasiosphaeria hispida]|uniref:Uncharacterized protein n=1 Tax=Lasiosphaeria hispida TaxID=260671 RepID=A0AAJ0HK65_9PEZI|nr:hypothetical protein B0T25DRAFT_135420 [Lasiosphaeria hispida]